MELSPVPNPRLDRAITILNIAAIISMVVALWAIFFYAPVELTMGNVQRLFYFHVGSAWVGALAFGVALVGGVLYLRSPQRRFDNMSVAAIEVGLVFLSMAIVGGSTWARPAWNTWWVWSPRLTLVTIAWLVYLAYFMLRGAMEDENKRARYAAVYAIISFATIILAYISIRILRDVHPVVFGGTTETAQGAAEGLQEFSRVDSSGMVTTLMINVAAFSILGAAWMLVRIRLQNLIDHTDRLKVRMAGQMSSGVTAGTMMFSGAALFLLQSGDPNRFNNYLIGGYITMSLIALFYIVYLAIRQRNVNQDLDLMKQLLQEDNNRPN